MTPCRLRRAADPLTRRGDPAPVAPPPSPPQALDRSAVAYQSTGSGALPDEVRNRASTTDRRALGSGGPHRSAWSTRGLPADQVGAEPVGTDLPHPARRDR